jgi:hypothetical protein
MLRERWIKAGTTGGASTRVYFFLTDATDYVTPETGEAAGQPQISTNGAAWTNTGIGTLVSIGNGSYYADLTTGAVATAGSIVLTRYKSSNTSEARGTTAIVTALAPSAETQTVSLGTSTIGTAQLVDGAITAAKFAANAITSTIVADSTITAAKIGADAITNGKIADNAIAVENIATGAITEPKVAALAFTAAKFASDLTTYQAVIRLVQTGASTQRITAIVTTNEGASVPHATFAAAPQIEVTTTAGTLKVDAEIMTAYGQAGYYYDLSGGSLLNAGESAEAVLTFTIGATTYSRYTTIENQYTA